MKKTKVEVPIPALTYAEAAAMKQADRITRFQVEASAGQRAFSAMGKLFRAIEAGLTKKDKGIFPLLIKAGIKKGTISNASYAAKVFDLVEAGNLNEAEYDQLSHADCFNICRVQSARSAKKLTADEVVAVIRSGGEPDEELSSLFEHGVTLEEHQAKAAAADKVKAEVAAAAEEKAKVEAAEIEKIKAENASLKAQAAEQSDPDPEVEDAKQGHPAAATDEDGEAVEPPTEGITPESVLAAIDEIELAFTELDEDGQVQVRARITELAEAVGIDLGKKKKKVVAA
jgi:hypothetical protein